LHDGQNALLHICLRRNLARRLARNLTPKYGQFELNQRAAKRLRLIGDTLAKHIQNLNDRYAGPSGKTAPLTVEKGGEPLAASLYLSFIPMRGKLPFAAKSCGFIYGLEKWPFNC